MLEGECSNPVWDCGGLWLSGSDAARALGQASLRYHQCWRVSVPIPSGTAAVCSSVGQTRRALLARRAYHQRCMQGEGSIPAPGRWVFFSNNDVIPISGHAGCRVFFSGYSGLLPLPQGTFKIKI